MNYCPKCKMENGRSRRVHAAALDAAIRALVRMFT